MKFCPHGVFSLHRDGQVIFIEAAGPWNLELIQQYAHEVLPVTKEVAMGGPWGAIVVVSKNVLFTCDAAAALRESGLKARANGRVAVAYVIPRDVEGALLAPGILKHIYDGVVPWNIFTELHEASNWMSSMIARSSAAVA